MQVVSGGDVSVTQNKTATKERAHRIKFKRNGKSRRHSSKSGQVKRKIKMKWEIKKNNNTGKA